MSFEILEPVDRLPFEETSRAPIWEAAVKFQGKWVPVKVENKNQAHHLANDARARNNHIDASFHHYEAKERGLIVYIRYVTQKIDVT